MLLGKSILLTTCLMAIQVFGGEELQYRRTVKLITFFFGQVKMALELVHASYSLPN